ENCFGLRALQPYSAHDLDLGLLKNFHDLLAALPAAALTAAPGRYLDSERYVLGVLKPEEGAAPAPAAAGAAVGALAAQAGD
ncbi:MAG: hypothetical protein AAF725_14380, partial [Acidobacteriota bacterium]